MAKKQGCPKKVPAKKAARGLASAAEKGGMPIRVEVERMSIKPPLRDMFAAFALAGIMAKSGAWEIREDDAAEASWAVADAMLKARGK